MPDCIMRLNLRQVERAGLAVEPQNCDQHQDRAEHRVQNEFHRGVNAAVVAPHADHEIHGDQRQFPEKKNRNRSSETKTPIIAVSITSMRDEEALHVFAESIPRSRESRSA